VIEYSKPFGTKIEVKDGMEIIRIPALLCRADAAVASVR
jgi:hypothetical protein